MGFFESLLKAFKGSGATQSVSSQQLAKEIMQSAGGRDNVKFYDWCSTRLSVYVENPNKININNVKPLLNGIIVKGQKLKFVVGSRVEEVAEEFGKLMPSCDPNSTRGIAMKFLRYFGGVENIKSLDCCTTRIKLVVKDINKVDKAGIKEMVPGVIVKNNNVQVIVGPEVGFVVKEIKNMIPTEDSDSPLEDKGSALKLLPYLGGAKNIKHIDCCTTRLKLLLEDPSRVSESGIKEMFPGVIKKGKELQVIVGPEVSFLCEEIKRIVEIQKTTGNKDDAMRLAKTLIPLLGGKNNIKEVDWCTTRLRLQIENTDEIDIDGVLEVVPKIMERANGVQIVVGTDVEDVAYAMKELLSAQPNPHLAGTLIKLLGGAMNIIRFEWCSTKLRIKVNNVSKVQKGEIEKISAGVVQNGRDIEIILGNQASSVGQEIKNEIE